MTAEQPTEEDRTYYEILGLQSSSQNVPLKDIKAAYHRALLASHPDKFQGTTGNSSELDLIREAWDVLSNDIKRKEYDSKLISKSLVWVLV